jgi:hypothetical protein
MGMPAFQIRDEFVRTSLSKVRPHLSPPRLAVVWSPSFVDQTIGENGATNILGYNVTATPIGSVLIAIGFAFVSGLTGTFTACNVAGLSAIAPLSAGGQPSLMSALRSLGWLALGTSLSPALLGRFPIRLIQSLVVFGILGLVLFVMGLAALGVIRLSARGHTIGRYASVRLLLIGGLIGAFLIGRPFPLFVKMFQYAAASHNPALGALVFVLHGLGNIALLALVFMAVAVVGRGRLLRWFAARPDRLARFNGIALLAAGTFSSPTGACGSRLHLGSAGGRGCRGRRTHRASPRSEARLAPAPLIRRLEATHPGSSRHRRSGA